ncbi:hypothetical protein BGZ67_006087 [Mortierella alpina]|nr:hypothetical protein BGZ67_006087 [Mortierella alpina]
MMTQHDVTIGPGIDGAGATTTQIRIYLSHQCTRFTYELKVGDPFLIYEHVFESTDGYCQEIHDEEDDEEVEEEYGAYETDHTTKGYDGEDEEEFNDGDDEGEAADDDSAASHCTVQDGRVPLQQPVPSSYLTCSTQESPIAIERHLLNPLSVSCTPKGQQQYESDADSTAMESGMAKQTGSVDAPSTTDSGREDPSPPSSRSNAITKTLKSRHYARTIDFSDTDTDTDAETKQKISPKTKVGSLVPGHVQSPAADTCGPCPHTPFPVPTRARNRLPVDNGFLLEEDQGAPLFVRRKRMLEMIHLAQIPLLKTPEVTRARSPGITYRRSQPTAQSCNDDSSDDDVDDDNHFRQRPGASFATLAPAHSVMLPCDFCLREFLITGQETVVDFAKHKVQCARRFESRQRFLKMRVRLEKRMAGGRGDTSSDESLGDDAVAGGTRNTKRC